jgi:hypothetical protein
MAKPHALGPGSQIHEAQERVAQLKARVRRRIVQGTPSQAAEDQLRRLEQTLLLMKEQQERAASAHSCFGRPTQGT